MGMLMLGLAGQPKMVACSLLALTKVTHQFRGKFSVFKIHKRV